MIQHLATSLICEHTG